MRDTQLIEHYLTNQLSPENKLVAEARLIIEPELRQQKYWQQLTYRLIKKIGRKKLREEIKTAEDRLFTEPEFSGFRKEIQTIFNLNQ